MDVEKKNVDSFKRSYRNIPFFGFYSFGEVGTTRKMSARSHSQTVTSLVIFDKLLSE